MDNCLIDSCGTLSTLKQGKNVRSPPTEEEVASETTCDELTTNSPSPCATLEKEIKKTVSQSYAQEDGRDGEKVFLRFILFLYVPLGIML